MLKIEEVPARPNDYEDCLSYYQECAFDNWCGEPIAWGFRITRRIGEDRFSNLHKFGKIEFIGSPYDGGWCLIVKELTHKEAIEKYGDVTDLEVGPRGGFKSITFGDKKFVTKRLRDY